MIKCFSQCIIYYYTSDTTAYLSIIKFWNNTHALFQLFLYPECQTNYTRSSHAHRATNDPHKSSLVNGPNCTSLSTSKYHRSYVSLVLLYKDAWRTRSFDNVFQRRDSMVMRPEPAPMQPRARERGFFRDLYGVKDAVWRPIYIFAED